MMKYFQKIAKKQKRLFPLIFLIVLFFVSLYFRVKGLDLNTPFWVDEFATADHALTLAKHGLNAFTLPNQYVEQHNITTHILVAAFFRMFGTSEFVARLPFAIIGSLLPVIIFILTRSVINTRTALTASLLCVFSYLQITWSRQARGYILLQVVILASMYLYYKIRDEDKTSHLSIFTLISFVVIGLATHSLYVLVILAMFFDFIIHKRPQLLKLLKKPMPYAVALTLGLFLLFSGTIEIGASILKTAMSLQTNNLWYYHSFLWRQYNLISFLAIVGFMIGAIFLRNKFRLIILFILFHLTFISFIFSPYVSRYTLPIFPLLLMSAAYVMTFLSDVIVEKININADKKAFARMLIPIMMAIFIVVNGDKFVVKPKNFYSVNHDFREIALIDYHQIYDVIRSEMLNSSSTIAMIDTWPGRSYWYLGQNIRPIYILRWKTGGTRIGGQIIARTPFVVDKNGNKVVPNNKGLRLVEDVGDLKEVISRHEKGFILIDDASLPNDVIKYAESNLKKELYLDHYTLDDNPYSIWPTTLYSWGVK